MDTQEVIPIYLKISELTGQMLEAAQNQNWDQLSELERNCAQQVQLLKQEASQIPLPGKLRTQKNRDHPEDSGRRSGHSQFD